ncbi:MAG: DUF2007 domain-containing protein [Woeseiaceae bacterium]|nr:DUF2007 domain-containing protein [Woeseiaceae bacterium]
MKKLDATRMSGSIHHYRNLLEAEGIATKIRNEHFGSIMGNVPGTGIGPELWVVNDLDYDRAMQLIDGSALDESPTEPWRCRRCGEDNEGQFAACWNCGAAAS